jgi:K+-sensing histidine kinase KdpD
VRNTLPDGVALRPAAERVPPEDRAWMAEAEQEQRRTTEKLEMELRGYQNNVIKESIRVSPTRLFAYAVMLMQPPDWTPRLGQLAARLRPAERCAQVLHAHARVLLHQRACRGDVSRRH